MMWKLAKISRTEISVLIIFLGLFLSFAFPQYQDFQIKARQKEGITLLSSFYTAAQASRAELGFYPGNFVVMGYAPAGQVHYKITSAENPKIYSIPGLVYSPNNSSGLGPEPTTKPYTTDTTFLAVGSATLKPGGTLDEWTVDERGHFENPFSGL
jgi:hypothetical protein